MFSIASRHKLSSRSDRVFKQLMFYSAKWSSIPKYQFRIHTFVLCVLMSEQVYNPLWDEEDGGWRSCRLRRMLNLGSADQYRSTTAYSTVQLRRTCWPECPGSQLPDSQCHSRRRDDIRRRLDQHSITKYNFVETFDSCVLVSFVRWPWMKTLRWTHNNPRSQLIIGFYTCADEGRMWCKRDDLLPVNYLHHVPAAAPQQQLI